jgi:hypothetical protein
MGRIIKSAVCIIGIFPTSLNDIESRVLSISRLHPIIESPIVNTLVVITIGMFDKGCEKPRIVQSSLAKRPTNIKSAMLKPTENRIYSRVPILPAFRAPRKTKPGINDK